MQINSDISILTNERVDINSNINRLNQALRIAVYSEMKAYETYMQIIEKFGTIAPFNNIIEAEKKHYAMLLVLLEKYKVEIPIDDFSQSIILPQTLLEACEIGVVSEIKNIKMYDDLLEHTKDYQDVQELFFQLQAASYNNHLIAFRQATQSVYAQAFQTQNGGIETKQEELKGLEQTVSQLDEFSKTIDSFSKGKINQNDILNLLNNKNISLIGGSVLGALGLLLLTQINKTNDEDNKLKEQGE